MFNVVSVIKPGSAPVGAACAGNRYAGPIEPFEAPDQHDLAGKARQS
jgi:hypothetical protein